MYNIILKIACNKTKFKNVLNIKINKGLLNETNKKKKIMKTINKIISTALLVVVFTSNILAKTDSLPTTIVERTNVNAQIKTILTSEANNVAIASNSENVVVKMMLDENGKALELKVFCENKELKEKIENKFKNIVFKDFQDYTYYYFKVTINKI
jgi:membrane carboxypeptidase/penicillin-binding protein PbpC